MTTMKQNDEDNLHVLAFLEKKGALITRLYTGDPRIVVYVVDYTDEFGFGTINYFSSVQWAHISIVIVDCVEDGKDGKHGKHGLRWSMGGICEDATAADVALSMKVIWSDVAERV